MNSLTSVPAWDPNAAAQTVWAKSVLGLDMQVDKWLPLEHHLTDSEGVAKELWDGWLSPNVKETIVRGVGRADTARAFTALAAGLHDVGKCTPAFAIQVPELASRMQGFGLTFDPAFLTKEQRKTLPHAMAGQLIVRRYLSTIGIPTSPADQLACVIGGHHGIPANRSQLDTAQYQDKLLGDARWQQVQDLIVTRRIDASGLDLLSLLNQTIGQPALALIQAIVIMADWIASNEFLFERLHFGTMTEPLSDRVQRAWDRLDLPRPWQATDTGDQTTDLLRQRFALPEDVVPRPVQDATVEAARQCDTPGLVIVEAEMGAGKTEASLLAAEILAARTGASGLFYALPTQATSNAMFARVLRWLSHVPDREVADSARTVALAHGKAHLDPVFRSLGQGLPMSTSMAQDEVDEPAAQRRRPHAEMNAYVHNWFRNRRTTPLAEVVVGTVDQVLFMALQARYTALRHLALASKVVVIDECHAYSAYMNVYLKSALTWLGAYRVPVILLSATLPSKLRAELTAAYRDGLASAESPASIDIAIPSWSSKTPTSSITVEPETEPHEVASNGNVGYPAVHFVKDGNLTTSVTTPSGLGRSVQIELRDDDQTSLADDLVEELADGGCVLVICNTVARAQLMYSLLQERLGSDVSLAHARFLATDRAVIDSDLLRRFSADESDRPDRHVVVATQVAEQSGSSQFGV